MYTFFHVSLAFSGAMHIISLIPPVFLFYFSACSVRDLVDIVRRAFKLSGLPNPLMNVPSFSPGAPVASITGIEEEGKWE